ncbi:hypothetical protein BAE44_0011873, partial [Dichanthelium oligosanthes]
LEAKSRPFDSVTVPERTAGKVSQKAVARIGYLPHGMVESNSDMELKPLWLTTSAQSQKSKQNDQFLIAIAAGINQKKTVDAIMKKVLHYYLSMLFHYDGNVNGWNDLPWSKSVIHIAASNQTKWWFAKRFLHPAVVSKYQYIFLWDEDLEVDNFNPRRYLNIVKSERLEISQPGLDSKLSEIHHRITVRKKTGNFHSMYICTEELVRLTKNVQEKDRRVLGIFSFLNPFLWVEGMAPVFSKSAWQCVWHLIQLMNIYIVFIQNDLIHGWGIDYKFGYCAQGDRTKHIGVVDSEFIVHRGVQTLGGSITKVSGNFCFVVASWNLDIRRKSRSELRDFHMRWDRAAREDRTWVDPFARSRRKRRNRNPQ